MNTKKTVGVFKVAFDHVPLTSYKYDFVHTNVPVHTCQYQYENIKVNGGVFITAAKYS